MELHNKQKQIVASSKRFKVVRGGRRGGKTKLEVEDMCFEAMGGNNRPIFYIAPTQSQARAIIWEELKGRLVGTGSEANEARLEMKVPTVDGGWSLISIAGWENRENFRGRKAWKIYFDEVDTMKDFFIGWQEIFRPALTDYQGHGMFCGTPKSENPNLRRLAKQAEIDPDWGAFHFKTEDNPHISREELKKAKEELDYNTFMQEYEAEYLDNAGALFHFNSLLDVFTNTVPKTTEKYLIIDVAEDGGDKWVFSFWEGLEEYRREEYQMSSNDGVNKIREFAAQEQIPYSNILVDAIGVGSNLPSEPLLVGIVGFKSSYKAIKTDVDIVRLPNVGYTKEAPLVSDYANLRSQCIFTLADHVNNRKIASRVTGKFREEIIEELPIYQDASKGDGKRMATGKDDVKSIIGHSPDHSDTWIMRMYFVVRNKMLPNQSEEGSRINAIQKQQMQQRAFNQSNNSTK